MRKEVHIMELQDVLNERRSIRSYDADKKVTKEQLEIIINAAILKNSLINVCRNSIRKIQKEQHLL